MRAPEEKAAEEMRVREEGTEKGIKSLAQEVQSLPKQQTP